MGSALADCEKAVPRLLGTYSDVTVALLRSSSQDLGRVEGLVDSGHSHHKDLGNK